eukprot:gnl/TRDRNA2_/TRDRNA2_85893_c0_seq1.p4 gnl/TRDRNA2_/TRDRNA2_85893_c0~~gnl/TRDRNA2_/TRDRNA2_85893_c0_seq1.p4  ORF type:complete len:104 (-),score=12.51 gnl/TRDRNA2_/TRDRNA2_85893_c0_seq1:203-514(-)
MALLPRLLMACPLALEGAAHVPKLPLQFEAALLSFGKHFAVAACRTSTAASRRGGAPRSAARTRRAARPIAGGTASYFLGNWDSGLLRASGWATRFSGICLSS